MEKTKRTQIASVIIAGVFMIVAITGSVYVFNQKDAQIKSLISEKRNLSQMMQQKDSVLNDVESAFTEIEGKLTFIKKRSNQIQIARSEGGKNRKQALIDDVNLMNTMLEESDKKIADLEQKLKNSGLNLKSYEKRLQNLTATIESQNTEIAELKKEIESKNSNLTELGTKIQNLNADMQKLADTISYKEKQIGDRTDKLNTAHVILGTYKELKKENILDREGGILKIGGSKAIQNNFDPKYFTELDIRETKTIPLNARKAVVISNHPNDSYSLVEENGQIAYLQIKNPDEFWRISKYAVIQVKK